MKASGLSIAIASAVLALSVTALMTEIKTGMDRDLKTDGKLSAEITGKRAALASRQILVREFPKLTRALGDVDNASDVWSRKRDGYSLSTERKDDFLR